MAMFTKDEWSDRPHWWLPPKCGKIVTLADFVEACFCMTWCLVACAVMVVFDVE